MRIDWSKIDTVLLDMDGTLLDLHYDNYFWRQHLPSIYAQKEKVSQQQALARLEPLFIDNAGTLNWYCVDFWSQQLGLDIMQHKREVVDKIAYRPKAQTFLTFCRQQVNDMRLVTNSHRQVFNLKNEITQIDQYFDQVVCSHELDEPKEKLAFWQKLSQQQAFDPERTVFIDDNEAMLDSAQAFGIKHLYGITEPDSNNAPKSLENYSVLDSLISLCV